MDAEEFEMAERKKRADVDATKKAAEDTFNTTVANAKAAFNTAVGAATAKMSARDSAKTTYTTAKAASEADGSNQGKTDAMNTAKGAWETLKTEFNTLDAAKTTAATAKTAADTALGTFKTGEATRKAAEITAVNTMVTDKKTAMVAVEKLFRTARAAYLKQQQAMNDDKDESKFAANQASLKTLRITMQSKETAMKKA